MASWHESMLGCQQAATDHGRGAAVKRRDGADASVMKSVNPGSPVVVSQWSEESCGQGGLAVQEMGTPAMSLFSAFLLMMTDVPDV